MYSSPAVASGMVYVGSFDYKVYAFAGAGAIPGDINSDGTVDIYDAIILAGAYNSKPGSPNWNAAADINGDNTVDIYDAIILAGHYGEKT